MPTQRWLWLEQFVQDLRYGSRTLIHLVWGRRRKLDAVADRINQRFGKRSIRRSGAG